MIGARRLSGVQLTKDEKTVPPAPPWCSGRRLEGNEKKRGGDFFENRKHV